MLLYTNRWCRSLHLWTFTASVNCGLLHNKHGCPLSICTNEKQHAVIRYFCSLKVYQTKIHRKPSKQYGDNVLPQWSVCEWVENFKNTWTSVKDKERAGRPTSSTTDSMIQTNWRVTIDEVAYHLQISHGYAYEIIHKRLGFHKVCARWVPNSSLKSTSAIVWTSVNAYWTTIMLMKVKLFWSSHWRCNVNPPLWAWKQMPEHGIETRRISSQKEIQESILCRKGNIRSILGLKRANSASYSEMLSNELKPAIRSKCSDLLSKGVLLLHDNVHPLSPNPWEIVFQNVGASCKQPESRLIGLPSLWST